MSYYMLSPDGRMTVADELRHVLNEDNFCAAGATRAAVVRLDEAAERSAELASIGDANDYTARIARVAFAEPTEAGLQYVIPGCERGRSRGPAQGSLF